MTDLEKFIKLYKDFGIDLKVRIENDNQVLDLNQKSIFGGSKKFTGYGGFSSDVIFNKEGKFISQGFWE